MRRKVRKICILLVTVLMLGMLAVPAGAATRKLINQKYTRQRAKAEAKARVVNLGTTTVVIPSKGRGYLKFKATKKKKYTFTLSGLRPGKAGAYANGYFYVMRKYGSGKYISMDRMKTQGGKSHALYLSNKNEKPPITSLSFLTSRSGKIKLKKNEVVYLYFNFSTGDVLKLNIK